MPLDRARTEEQPGADLRVRQAVSGEARDVELLRCQLVGRLSVAAQRFPAEHGEFTSSAFGKGVGPHRQQHLVSGAKLLACLRSFADAAQPFAVEQVTARHLQPETRTLE